MRRFLEVQFLRSNKIIILAYVVILIGSVASIFNGNIFGAMVMGAIALLLYYTSLKTEISRDGITYSFTPLFLKPKHISWNEVSRIDVRNYSPIREYGGWGIRLGFEGMAYNIAGDKGLQIILNNGKRILIGTQRAEEMKRFLNEIAKDKL